MGNGSDERLLIVGLGNPGKQYSRTRHNVGFMVVDRISELTGIKLNTLRYQALIGRKNGLILVKPMTFMNLSGRAVAPLLQELKLTPSRLLVIYDDLDLPFGTIRIKPKGGSGGHKGVMSIISSLGTEEFPRVRVGILGAERKAWVTSVVDYVLSPFSKEELEYLNEVVEQAAAAALMIYEEGLEKAMNEFNPKRLIDR